jgi:3-(3-hydroxy-phenyl)propionate hydroxylase
MKNHSVLIVGAGPTGLMLAGELALAGVDVAIVERSPAPDVLRPRARGILARTIEILDQRGIADRFISQGQKHEVSMFSGARFSADMPTRHNYVLGLLQKHLERILAEWVAELAVPVHRGVEVVGFAQDESGVDVELSGGRRTRTQYLVGCDGGRSFVRKTAGIDFPGWDATTSWLIAELQTTEEPAWGFRHYDGGTHAIGKGEGGAVGMVLMEPLGRTAAPTLDDLKRALLPVYGTDFGIHSPVFISSFTDMTRQAAEYRKGRVLLAGDAAHIHAPIGGQGLNLGMQDAVNLGWKLAQVVKGQSPDGLLDTYHAERHPVAARTLRTSMALVALGRQDARSRALEETLAPVLAMEEPSEYLTAMTGSLDVHYDLGAGHPLLGRRMPDVDLETPDGSLRAFELLHGASPVLLNLGAPGRFDIATWADRVQVIEATASGAWELPVVGPVAAPTAVLIRPDGHVAWVEGANEVGLEEAIAKWFGPGVKGV